MEKYQKLHVCTTILITLLSYKFYMADYMGGLGGLGVVFLYFCYWGWSAKLGCYFWHD